jgi:hypothetical protein
MNKGILFILFVLFTVTIVEASSMGFLLIDPLPNSVALANGGMNSIHNNPACMCFEQTRGVTFSHVEWFTDVRIEHLQGVYQTERYGIGADITYLHAGDIPGYDALGNSTGPFSIHDAAFALSFGYFIGKISTGVSVKIVQEKLDDVTANSFAGDVGIMVQDIIPGFDCGVSVLNLGTGITYEQEKEDFPLAVKGLMHYALADYTYDIYMNVNWEKDGNIIGGLGVEALYFEMLSLRLGYSISKEEVAQKGLTAGLGVKFAKRYSFDYAAIPFSEFGMLHYAGLSIRF